MVTVWPGVAGAPEQSLAVSVTMWGPSVVSSRDTHFQRTCRPPALGSEVPGTVHIRQAHVDPVRGRSDAGGQRPDYSWPVVTGRHRRSTALSTFTFSWRSSVPHFFTA